MHARQRKPTIRRVRDWDPYAPSPVLRAPRVPLDLVPPPAFVPRDTVPMIPAIGYEEDDEEATLARFVPLNSEVRAILDDPEQTLAYMRKVQASIPDSDSALDSLVKVYEERVARLAKERAHAEAIVAQAMTAADEARAASATRRKKPVSKLERTMLKMQPHLWKIVYGAICFWGLAQLALTR